MQRFGFPVEDFGSWLEDLLQGKQADLLELAEYLKVPITGAVNDGDIPGAAAVDTYSELVAAETAFREIVRSTIGDSWVGQLAPDKVEALREKRDAEDKRRDGVSVSQDLLDYTEAYQLEPLILKNWDKTGPVLKDKKRTEVYLNLMLDVRNTIAHARPVVPFERHLLAGIAGQFQNLISRHRSESETADSYYASINTVRDSSGEEGLPSGSTRTASNTRRIKVGDVIEFDCSATDPFDREVSWRFQLFGRYATESVLQLGDARGAVATFRWEVAPEHFGEDRHLIITVANNSPYHRRGGADDSVSFYFDINPPVSTRLT